MSNEYYKTLPKKRMGVGALFFNNKGELLIVKPSYKDHWSIPGGVVDENESPRQACIREIKEEIGLDIKQLDFFCVDYKAETEEKTESLQFIFLGGTLSQNQINQIQIDNNEIGEYMFVEKNQACQLIGESIAKRLLIYYNQYQEGQAYYLEDGK